MRLAVLSTHNQKFMPRQHLAPALIQVCACLFLASCGTGKKNASATLISARLPSPSPEKSASAARNQGTMYPSFPELVSLADNPKPGPLLAQKINRLFSTPVVVNKSLPKPRRLSNETLGSFLRVATWNIEKSLHAKEAAEALKSEAAFKARLKPAVLANEKRLAEALRQRERLITADVLLLQEMDVGVSRSGYLDAAREIAKALGMNYTYAPMQLEIDPVLLGLEPGASKPDPARYKGAFGLAVLSRYPILAANCFQLQAQSYDWYEGEQQKPDPAEHLRRIGAKLVFKSDIQREMKIGGHNFFRVDLQIPGLPNDRLTVIHNHLEIKTTTRGREAQLQEILSHARSIPHAVIMAGDHNSASVDVSPTSIKRIVKRTATDTQTYFNIATSFAVASNIFSLARNTINITKNLHNPLAANFPLILPNRTRRLFHLVEDFRFDDGGAFDTRGDRERSINGSSRLFANSNERYILGLTPTFRVPRPVGPFGRTRLDWIFVKQPAEWQGSYRFAPHFGETLSEFDRALTQPYSDHRPCVVDLPFEEPPGL
jgi:endonuclease/exonuclease/phosphatase family metal-dependent hydrolase